MLPKKLQKVSLAGGAPQFICDAPGFFSPGFFSSSGGSWGADDTIVFGGGGRGLRRVSAAGGSPEQLIAPYSFTREKREAYLFWPQHLPGDEWLLFTSFHLATNQRISVLNLETGERRVVQDPGMQARYVPTGHLVFAWAGDVLVAPFDLARLEVTGPAVPVQEGVSTPREWADFAVSGRGTFVFAPGELWRNDNHRLVWVDHEGAVDPLPLPLGAYLSARVSPDGGRLVASRLENRADLWIHEFERGTWHRLTDETADELWPIWTPDGERVVFNANRHGGPTLQLHWKPADGSARAERLAETAHHAGPATWSLDGKTLLFSHGPDPSTGWDIWQYRLDGDHQPESLINARCTELNPTMSPDGRWLAYVTNEPGSEEVVVQPYPGLGAITPISVNGGRDPTWAADGTELYYAALPAPGLGPFRMMAVTFDGGPPVRVGPPRLLFEGRYMHFYEGREYDIAPDGERFLLIEWGAIPPAPVQLNVELNWFEELKAKVPAGSM